jgi:hypothetical protein
MDLEGCLTFWTARHDVSREKLQNWLRIHAASSMQNTLRRENPLTALRLALSRMVEEIRLSSPELRESRFFIRPLRKRKMYAIVEETAEGKQLRHRHWSNVGLTDDAAAPQPYFEGVDRTVTYHHQDGLQRWYERYLDLIPPSALSSFLTRYLEQVFHAVCLRPSGGIYQFRIQRYDDWLQVAQGIRDCAANPETRIFTLRHSMDTQAASAILTAMRRDLQARIDELKRDFSSETLGKRARQNRAEYAVGLVQQVREVEKLLQTSLPEYHEALQEVSALAGGLKIMSAAESLLPTSC